MPVAPQAELLEAFATAFEAVEGLDIEQAPDAEILDPLREKLKQYCGFRDGVQVQPTEQGILVDDSLVLSTDESAIRVRGLLRSHRATGVYIPAWIHPGHLWRFLLVVAMDPQRIIQAGGLEFCMERVGCKVVRIHMAPAPPNETTVPFAPLPELEEIDRRLAVSRSGDTVESLPFERPKNKNEKAQTYQRLTREIVRAFGPDGPDAAARALLLTWRRIAVVHADRQDAPLEVPSVVAMLHRIDPLTRFAVLAQIGYTPEGKKIAGQIPDGELAESICSAVTWDYPGGHSACMAVLRTARPGAMERQPILAIIRSQLQQLGRADDPVWGAIEESSATE